MKVAIFALACALLSAQVLAQPTGAPTSGPPSPPAQPTSAPTAKPPSTGPSQGPQTSTPTLSPSAPNAASLTPGSGSSPTDADILYFAYNLEIFESDFYNCAANGSPTPSQYRGGGPAPTGCTKGNYNSSTATFIAELAREEEAHVALLFNALTAAGAKPVAPQVDISTATFNKAAVAAANGASLPVTFDPYANDLFVLHAAFLFEDLGTSAYLGALNSISNSSYRLVAAQIGAAEAYHSALDRTLLYQQLNTVTPLGLNVANVTDLIVALENKVAEAPQIKYNLFNDQGSSVANVDANGLVPAASAQQVLRVVTLGAPAGSGGGFFPNNLNGNVKN